MNRPGGYDCPCKRGMSGDGKAGTCSEKFPLQAKIVVGTWHYIRGDIFSAIREELIMDIDPFFKKTVRHTIALQSTKHFVSKYI
jgi:hypothetical protein